MPPTGKQPATGKRKEVPKEPVPKERAARSKRICERIEYDGNFSSLESECSDEDDDDDSEKSTGSEESTGKGKRVVSLKPKQPNPQGKHKTNLSNPHLKYRDSETGERCDKTNPNRYRISILGDFEKIVGFASENPLDVEREQNDPKVKEAQAYLQKINAGCGPSDQQTQDRVRSFEDYCVENHPNDSFTLELRSLPGICDMKEGDRPPKKKFPVRLAFL
jgi:hypothetical protein